MTMTNKLGKLQVNKINLLANKADNIRLFRTDLITKFLQLNAQEILFAITYLSFEIFPYAKLQKLSDHYQN